MSKIAIGRSIALKFVIAVLIFITATSTVFAQSDGSAGIGQLSADALAIANAVNQARADAGLPPLAVHPLLTLAAQAHVDDLLAHGMAGHYGSDGSNVAMRVRRTGYASGWVSENWVNTTSPSSAIEWWMNDWIHRVNILNPNWDEFGVGVGDAGGGRFLYFTDFANSDGQASAAPIAVTATFGAEEQNVPAGGLDYTIRAGDTLLGIALRYGLDWQDIATANKMGENDLLQIGRSLYLPDVNNVGGPAASDSSPASLYTVSAGDTLSSIAAAHRIDWQAIASANNLGEFSVLRIGMVLRLPGVESLENAANDAPSVSTTQAPAEVNSTPSVQAPVTVVGRAYSVRAGDTLFSIAVRNGISWEKLAAANQLDEDSFLQIGQLLTIPLEEAQAASAPTSGAVAAAASTASATTYIIKPGDTIMGIAIRLGVDWQELLRINDLTESSLLQAGQVIRLE